MTSMKSVSTTLNADGSLRRFQQRAKEASARDAGGSSARARDITFTTVGAGASAATRKERADDANHRIQAGDQAGRDR